MSAKRQEAPGELERVREFVNTADFEAGREDLSSPSALVAWLAEHGLATPGIRAARQDLVRALELREAIRAVLIANAEGLLVPDGARQAIDREAERAGLRPRLRADGSSELQPAAAGVDGALGRLLAAVHRSVADGSWKRLKACRDPECLWAFFDHTKNRSGSWCTMDVCGNRAKARAYRARRRTASGGVVSGEDRGDPVAVQAGSQAAEQGHAPRGS